MWSVGGEWVVVVDRMAVGDLTERLRCGHISGGGQCGWRQEINQGGRRMQRNKWGKAFLDLLRTLVFYFQGEGS